MFSKVIFLSLALVLGAHGQQNLGKAVKADDQFTTAVFKELCHSQKGNIIFSGVSSDIVLSLLASGAKQDTRSELLLGLNLVKDDNERNSGFKELTPHLNIANDNVKLTSANKLYIADKFPVNEEFKNIALNNYQAEIENINYSDKSRAANLINNWVKEKTNGKIENLVEENNLSDDIKLLIANTLYFSGEWKEPFTFSRKAPFYATETETKELQYMEDILEAKYRHCGYYKVSFLELDFKGGNISMTFVLPDNKTDFEKIQNELAGVSERHAMRTGLIQIILPKFRIENKLDLVPVLQKLGIEKVFTEAADLSGISRADKLKVDSIVQKAFIDVSEAGVEAAVATGVHVVPTSAIQPEFTFNANRPFLYYIRENNSGALLFAGRFSG